MLIKKRNPFAPGTQLKIENFLLKNLIFNAFDTFLDNFFCEFAVFACFSLVCCNLLTGLICF